MESGTGKQYARILCLHYNYMVEIGPLNPGVYNMDVYYESYQYNYIGSTTFEIITTCRSDTMELAGSYSSDCYFLSSDGIVYNTPINVSNDQLNKSVDFRISINGNYNLDVITLQGKTVFQYEFADTKVTSWSYNDIPTGIYIYKLSGKDIYYSGKIMIVN